MSELDRILRQRRSNSADARAIIAEIEELDSYCQQLYYAAISDEQSQRERRENGEDVPYEDIWEKVFDAVFEGGISRKVIGLASKIGMSFDWYDPDTTYEEDATAFINELHSFARGL
ncbi:MAG: hypothetical protein DI537_54850 [Stutzerimonas stutzeri]|nr:MAG: hypothetical protein DI537_54850 [Stutzerimonas stutzeri]